MHAVCAALSRGVLVPGSHQVAQANRLYLRAHTKNLAGVIHSVQLVVECPDGEEYEAYGTQLDVWSRVNKEEDLPLEMEETTKVVCCVLLCCINRGHIRTALHLPKTVYVAGETVDVRFEVENQSQVDASNIVITLEIYEHTEITAGSNTTGGSSPSPIYQEQWYGDDSCCDGTELTHSLVIPRTLKSSICTPTLRIWHTLQLSLRCHQFGHCVGKMTRSFIQTNYEVYTV